MFKPVCCLVLIIWIVIIALALSGCVSLPDRAPRVQQALIDFPKPQPRCLTMEVKSQNSANINECK